MEQHWILNKEKFLNWYYAQKKRNDEFHLFTWCWSWIIYSCSSLSWSSPSTWAPLTSLLRPLSWQPISYWQRKPLLWLSPTFSFELFVTHCAQGRYHTLIIAFVLCIFLSISEQPDLAPVVAFAKIVIELPLSVSGWVKPPQFSHQWFFHSQLQGNICFDLNEGGCDHNVGRIQPIEDSV